jgi:hypothetical protein
MSRYPVTTRQVADEALYRANGAGGSEHVTSSGTTTLVSGVSPVIHTPITATSKFAFALKSVNGSTTLGIPSAIGIVTGDPGAFQVGSSEIGTPASAQTGDASTYFWYVFDST